MTDGEPKADQSVDDLYRGLRGRYGEVDPSANGYRYSGYFETEQKTLMSLVDRSAKVVVDVGCGSGLMAKPLCDGKRLVVGVDFNRDACHAAANNGLQVIRGDAFCLPFAENSVDEIITCQFFNQQRPQAVEQFMIECEHVLRPGGRLIMVWRNGAALVHRFALVTFSVIDRVLGRPHFPHEDHPIPDVTRVAETAGLIVERCLVTFPTLRWSSENTSGALAKCIGASAICIVNKPATLPA